jgi:tetratricopeptide (TPR) repeat protein/predicted aspartyl protease
VRHRSIGFSLALVLAAIAGRAAADCKLERYAELPVTMAGTRPLITGSINGVAVQFLADTGAFFNMISRETAERLKLRSEALPEGFLVWGVGGAALPSLATAKDFTLVGLSAQTFHKVPFIEVGNFFVTDENGIIGQNLLGHADGEYDLANGFIRLFYAKDCRGKPLAYWHGADPVAVIEMEPTLESSPQLIGSVKLNGTKIKVMFDSGASHSILSLRAAARAGIKPDSPGVVSGGQSRGIGKHVAESWLARFDSLDLGGEEIKNARLRIADIDLPDVDMLLGADFFLSHRIYVANSQRKIYFTFNGGRVFDLTVIKADKQIADQAAAAPADQPTDQAADAPAAAAAQQAPMDAAGFRRRGAASAGRRDFRSAIADYDQAVRLDPADADNYYQRAIARWQNGQAVLAMADFDQALKIRSDDIPTLIGRGALRLSSDDEAGARTDFEAVDAAAPHDATIGLRIADEYVRFGHFAGAIERFDRWIAAYPSDERLPAALNGRCWSRAMLNQGLTLALADCNAAVRSGRNSQFLDSRALVWLRLGDVDKSITDYKASLSLQSKSAWSLYGLGVAELRKGMREQSDRDMQAGVALWPSIAGEFKKAGLVP